MGTQTAIPLAEQQHLVLHDVPWGFYESVLKAIGDRPTRVTYSDGSIEIMSPLPEHELIKKAIARLIEDLTVELNIPMIAYGSATFRREDRSRGLEPDECYYMQSAKSVQGMKEYDPSIHPAPDLAVEVDVTSRSIPRQPIYAALGVPELWRYAGERLQVLKLDEKGIYQEVPTSLAFPFLPMESFAKFLRRMLDGEQTTVLREYRQWVRTLGH